MLGVFSVFLTKFSVANASTDIQFKCLKMFPLEEAIEDCSKLIEIEPKNPNGYLYRGWVKYLFEDYVGAIYDFNEVINLSPQNIKAYSLRESSRLFLQDYQGVIQDSTIIIELEPNNIYAYMDRGKAKFFLDDNRGAIDDFNKVIELSGERHEAYLYRGLSKFQLKDHRGAILDFSLAINQLEIILAQPAKDLSNLSPEMLINLKKLKKVSDEILKKEVAEAYRFRGISKLIIEEVNSGCIDLSKAGEKGDDEAYNLIKKYCN
jgi:tetratricopeptide (TPR) repeat protein